MRSIIYHHYGEPAEVLKLTEAPALPPPGPGEVLIHVASRPVHPGDLLGIRGRYRVPGKETPVGLEGARPGFEGMGVIESVGAGVDGTRGLVPGARVAFFPARWAWSDKVLAPARFVTVLPATVSDAAGAQLHVGPLTAALLLRAVQATGAQAGAVVALSAAGGLVARLTARLLLDAGYQPLGIVRAQSGVDALMTQLPDMPVVSTERPDWVRRACTLMQGRPVEVALDPVGGAIASAMVAMLADGGSLVSYGDLSGEPLVLPALAFSTRGIRIKGVSVGRWAALPDNVRECDLQTAIGLTRSMPDVFVPAAQYGLEDIATAVQHAERAGKTGTVLLR
jgi:NADPH:quinone reductase-like Zn-dependent oxidoreductase